MLRLPKGFTGNSWTNESNINKFKKMKTLTYFDLLLATFLKGGKDGREKRKYRFIILQFT